MPSTYTPIATTKINDASTSSYTFSSIPATYTDLVISITGQTTTTSQDMRMRFNGDTGTNYSFTMITNTQTSSNSYAASNQNAHWIDYDGTATVPFATMSWRVDIMNYSSTNVYKTYLAQSFLGWTNTNTSVALWRSTSAINSILIYPSSGNFAKYTTISLYGIKAA